MNAQNFGNMMGAQQPPQQQHPPQQQRLQQVILAQLRQSHRPQPGQWQATLNAEQRAGMLWNIYTAIRLAKPEAPDQQVLQMAFGNENERFVKAQSRDDYIRTVKELLQRLQTMRQQNMQNMQAQMMQPGSNAANPQPGGLPGNADFDFAQLTNQQADAMRSAQAGHDVVPASNNASINQMGGFNPMSGSGTSTGAS
ncbi:hypothetical protein GTA08_BOTSDO03541 [Neofusicoccum parvum]|uniref:Uncharacterized protein n=1 Tax=Neofusicoccum parvum TaxID=310453 RepID=A0ACB5S6K8_9PEZI|nr:hypothetical protein GTA08_BOTSDO03541 [Neofusicoccum parvum]